MINGYEGEEQLRRRVDEVIQRPFAALSGESSSPFAAPLTSQAEAAEIQRVVDAKKAAYLGDLVTEIETWRAEAAEDKSSQP